MAKRYVVPIALLLVVLWTMEWMATRLPGPEIDLELDSHQIGWSAATEARTLALDVFDRVNEERAARGLAPVMWDEDLAEIAGRWSEEMLASGYRHSTEAWRAHPSFPGTGENIAMGYGDTAELHVGWMESDGHRTNILTPGYTAIGVGIVCRNDGLMWATQIFGMPHGASGPVPTFTEVEPIVRRDRGASCDRGLGWRW